jgi:hypothetical protein
MSEMVLRDASWIGAALAGVLFAGVYVQALWHSAEATVRSRSLRPFALGAAARLALLGGLAAMLVVLRAGPVLVLSFFTAFLLARWLLVRRLRETPLPERKIAR